VEFTAYEGEMTYIAVLRLTHNNLTSRIE